MSNGSALLVTHEPLEPRMAGPAIRAWHLAQELAGARPVILATPAIRGLQSPHPAVTLVAYDPSNGVPLTELTRQSAVIITSGYLLRRYPALVRAGLPLAIDLYDPFVLENLQIHSTKSTDSQVAIHQSDLGVLEEQLRHGDFFVCASRTQRDFWLGMLVAFGRVNPHTLKDDPTLRRLIDIVPFGVPDTPPMPGSGGIKGHVPGIGRDDRVIYWGGGIWDWFDPLTLIRAVAQIAEQRDDVRLFFAGVRHPSPDVPAMRMCQAATGLSNSLGLTGRIIFFNDWVPYDRRGEYLLDADVGTSLHFAHVETRFAFRTRLLDYVWAGLPMIVTQGDAISEWVARDNLGRVVAAEDVDGVRQMLLTLLDAPDFRARAAPRFEQIRAQLRWSQVSAPLLAFCTEPYHSADWYSRATPAPPSVLSRAWRVLRTRGIRQLARETNSYLAWRRQSG